MPDPSGAGVRLLFWTIVVFVGGGAVALVLALLGVG